ncbi:PAS domain S-box protein [Thermanaerosceptrum fracticalcis]|uniref:HTH-type transcriptional regulatory protein TyrR n=1 Tax=Thermanaerosceptrum fracticalcis TaxID=1712410 RepID=A0A7G6E791_THEFR|nr:sigma 54-interacting transcriptional regulator [Thermanaerosceptrum fracticalcis]QNB47945.1 PAS domain S-box protein [Thermanaerosceptrum fracticalcis]
MYEDRRTSDSDLNKIMAQELNSIFEASYDGLYICDKDGRVVRVNSAWEKISGFPRQAVIGKNVKELVEEGYYDNSAALLTIESKKTSTTMLKITSGPKKGQVIMATGTPILDEKGELVQVVVNVRDITDLENLKAQLNETMQLTRRYADELEEIRLQQQKIDDIVVKSPSMQRIAELVVRVSRVDSTVLITGESGVGKEIIARKIHLLSNRKNNSLIKINCGAIPENLLESELFGYEAGAFSGARREGKPGMIELASGGTLFLDEIGDLPLNLQVKLLRVLQEREITRVGGIKPIQVDTRIIAATNKDLTAMLKKGTFRQDLFYRLNVVNIEIPPLRERREDLVALIPVILHKINEKYNLRKKLSPQVMERFLKYHWPGNIREIENTLERLVVLTNEDVIGIDHLPDYLKEEKSHHNKIITFDSIVPLKTAVEEVEYQMLAMALEKYGSTRAMAKALGVNQSTIVRKMRQYRMDKNDALEHLNGA